MKLARQVRAEGARRLGATALLWLAIGAATAKPVIYRCEDQSELSVDFTPRVAQVRVGAKHWTLTRVRDSQVAHFVNRRDGISLVSQKREAVLQIGKQELRCKFEVMRAQEEVRAP